MNVHAPQTPAGDGQQYPRFKVPAQLVVEGRTFEVLDWSRDGVGFKARDAGWQAGDSFDAELKFDFPGASLSAVVAAEVSDFDAASGRGGLNFRTHSDSDGAVIDFIIEEHLAGRIMSSNGILDKTETTRAEPVTPAAQRLAPKGMSETLRRVAGLGIFSVGGLLALYFLGSSVYNRVFVFEAASAQIIAETLDLDTPVAGTVVALATPGPIAPGAPVFAIEDAAGTRTDVPSPCDCDVIEGGRPVGSFASPGAVVQRLIPRGARPLVAVSVAFPDVRRIYAGAAVDLEFVDGASVHGARIVEVENLKEQGSGLVTVMVDPGFDIPPARFGEPVYARFDNAPWRH